MLPQGGLQRLQIVCDPSDALDYLIIHKVSSLETPVEVGASGHFCSCGLLIVGAAGGLVRLILVERCLGIASTFSLMEGLSGCGGIASDPRGRQWLIQVRVERHVEHVVHWGLTVGSRLSPIRGMALKIGESELVEWRVHSLYKGRRRLVNCVLLGHAEW